MPQYSTTLAQVHMCLKTYKDCSAGVQLRLSTRNPKEKRKIVVYAIEFEKKSHHLLALTTTGTTKTYLLLTKRASHTTKKIGGLPNSNTILDSRDN